MRRSRSVKTIAKKDDFYYTNGKEIPLTIDNFNRLMRFPKSILILGDKILITYHDLSENTIIIGTIYEGTLRIYYCSDYKYYWPYSGDNQEKHFILEKHDLPVQSISRAIKLSEIRYLQREGKLDMKEVDEEYIRKLIWHTEIL